MRHVTRGRSGNGIASLRQAAPRLLDRSVDAKSGEGTTTPAPGCLLIELEKYSNADEAREGRAAMGRSIALTIDSHSLPAELRVRR
jgi:hypothetical protein